MSGVAELVDIAFDYGSIGSGGCVPRAGQPSYLAQQRFGMA